MLDTGEAAARWENWRSLISGAKDSASMTFADIAAELGGGLNPDTICNYFSGKSRPPLELLNNISDAVGVNPLEGLAALGLFPKDLGFDIRELEETRRKNRDLERILHMHHTASAATHLVNRLLASDYGVCAWPVFEGERFGPVLVSQRLAVTPRTPFSPISEEVTDFLSSRGAVKVPEASTKGRHALEHLRPHGRRDYQLWSLPLLTAPRPAPPRLRPAGKLRSVVVFGLTQAARPNDTGSLVAYALGFGYMSTRYASARLHGGIHPVKVLNQQQNAAARVLFEDIERDARRVWSHHGVPIKSFNSAGAREPHAVVELLEHSSARTCVVWVRETPELLEFHRSRVDSPLSLNEMRLFQAEIEQALSKTRSPVLTMDVDLPRGSGARSHELMDQCLQTSAQIVPKIEEIYGVELVHLSAREEEVPEALRRAIEHHQ